jgi:negative regulator of sigma-B (phosphoserine phosphatase)
MEEMNPAAKVCAFTPPIAWGYAGRPLDGQTESGDLHLVEPFPGGVLVAVLDGLGHGPEAALASQKAVATLRDNLGEPVTVLVERCHAALRKTRGVVLSLASIETQGHDVTWLSVGNVDGTLHHAGPRQQPREALPHRGGVVGYQLPPLRATTLPFAPGDTLVFATDGIASTHASESAVGWDPQDAADHILRIYGKNTDDALVVVVRNVGDRPWPA